MGPVADHGCGFAVVGWQGCQEGGVPGTGSVRSGVVYGALSSHRQTGPAALAIPLQARSVGYGTKAVRGSWLKRWFGTASP